jgi:hypothetical protein
MKKIIEQTSSASSGSFETSMGSGMVRRNFHPFFDIDSEEVQPKKKKKQLNKKKKTMKQITISEIENIILKTLIHEEVYSEKPIESKGKESSSKNAKSKVTTKTSKKIDDITVKSGKESKSDVSGRTKKVSDSLKNNLKGAEVKDVNKDKKVDDDYETEAYQNGMEDIAYERISDEQKEKNSKYIKSSEMRKNPNAEKSGKAADKMIKQAKQRGEAKKLNPFNSTYSLGKDMEFINNKDKQITPRKKLGMNENIIKRLTFKSQFRDDKDMLRKIPSNYRQNDLVFEMYDGDSNYKVRWEGTENNGVGVIIEHKSASKEMKNMKMFESLNNFERLDFQPERNVQSSNLNENQIFKQMLNQSRRLINEIDNSTPRELPSFGQQSPFIFGSGTGRPLDKGNASSELLNNVKTLNPDNKDFTLVLPAPESASAEDDKEIEKYNNQLNDFLKQYYGDLSLQIEWMPSVTNSFVKGRYQMKDEEDFVPTDASLSKEVPTFGRQNPFIVGMGTGRPLDTGNTSEKIVNRIKEIYKDITVVVPAPENDIASKTEEIASYNKQLNDFLKNYYDKLDMEIEWSPSKPNSFINGKYQVKGETVQPTAETPLYNLNFDRAYNYLKIGDKYYVQKKGQGNANDPKQYFFVDPVKNNAAYDAIVSKVSFK